MPAHYDVIIVGTGFASSFFLMRYLERAPKSNRVLVLERGNEDTKPWQLEHRLHTSIDPDTLFNNDNPGKEWYTSPGFGGNSKCWMGGTTRMMPGDFKLKSRYGVGTDWPLVVRRSGAALRRGRAGHARFGAGRQPNAAFPFRSIGAAPIFRPGRAPEEALSRRLVSDVDREGEHRHRPAGSLLRERHLRIVPGGRQIHDSEWPGGNLPGSARDAAAALRGADRRDRGRHRASRELSARRARRKGIRRISSFWAPARCSIRTSCCGPDSPTR